MVWLLRKSIPVSNSHFNVGISATPNKRGTSHNSILQVALYFRSLAGRD
jgi:hypothetical protein